MGGSPSAASGGYGSGMHWPANAANYVPPPAPAIVAPAAADSADVAIPDGDELVTYYMDGSHNVQVTGGLLDSAREPEAAYMNAPRSLFMRKKRAEDEININPLPEHQEKNAFHLTKGKQVGTMVRDMCCWA